MGSARTGLEPLARRDPRRIGGYSLLGRLGSGAMGRVYLGKSASGRLVAVKTIKSDFAGDADFRSRFAREVVAARRVSGVFTAAVVAADPEADVPWLATAYIPAPSLERLVRSCGPLPVPALRWLAAGCAEALESIHQVGLVHRDLKPSNVLVSAEGPQVIDFGVARAAERVTATATHQAVGTPAYMAPEQARDSRHTTPASDVFSLGSTLLFAATGHPPYAGDSVTDVLLRLATEPPDLTGLPDEVAELVTGCLERDPDARPTAGALLARLAPELDQNGGTPLPDGALALLEEYRREPRPAMPAARAEGLAEDTLDSPTSLRAPAPAMPSRRGRLVLAAAIVLAAVVLASGIVLGRALDDDDPRPHRPPPPPGTAPGADGLYGPPRITLNQNFGDGNTGFVVHGAGLRPGRKVTLRLDGGPSSPSTPVVDVAGTFNYVVNQNHEFYAGKIPPGAHRLTVTVTGVAQPLDAAFTVNNL